MLERDESPSIAKEHADCTRAETARALPEGRGDTVHGGRGLNDDHLFEERTVFTRCAPMTAERLIMLGLLGHIDDTWGASGKPSACDTNRPRRSPFTRLCCVDRRDGIGGRPG